MRRRPDRPAQPLGVRSEDDAASTRFGGELRRDSRTPRPSTTPSAQARFIPQVRSRWSATSASYGQFRRQTVPSASTRARSRLGAGRRPGRAATRRPTAGPAVASLPPDARPRSRATLARPRPRRGRAARAPSPSGRRRGRSAGRERDLELAVRAAVELGRAAGARARPSAAAAVLGLEQGRPRRADRDGRRPARG